MTSKGLNIKLKAEIDSEVSNKTITTELRSQTLNHTLNLKISKMKIADIQAQIRHIFKMF